MWKIIVCLRPSSLTTDCQQPTSLSDFHEILAIRSLSNLLNKYEFRGNWLSKSRILLKGLSELPPVIPLFRGR